MCWSPKYMLDYDRKRLRIIGAFAAKEKQQITLRSVMSHQGNSFSIQSIDVDNDMVLDWQSC